MSDSPAFNYAELQQSVSQPTDAVDFSTTGAPPQQDDIYYDQLKNRTRYLTYRIFDPSISCYVGNIAGGHFILPFDGIIYEFSYYVDTAGTTNAMTVDFNYNGSAYVANVSMASGAIGSQVFRASSLAGARTFKKFDYLTWDINGVSSTPALGLVINMKLIETSRGDALSSGY